MQLQEKLEKIFRPQLYKYNAFRILQLPVNYSGRDLNQRKMQITSALEAEMEIPKGSGCSLDINWNYDKYQFLEVFQRLDDPEERLIDEFFWFWPENFQNSTDDIALKAMRDEEPETALSHWDALKTTSVSALHNLAVYAHVKALDLELQKNGDIQEQLNIFWKRAYQRWKLVFDNPDYWELLCKRVEMINDPRLTRDDIEFIRNIIPTGLLSINALMAVEAAEKNVKDDNIQRHLEIIKMSGFPQSTQDRALNQAVKPIIERITDQLHLGEKQISQNPIRANEIAERLLKQCGASLNIIDVFLSSDVPDSTSIHDEVALHVLEYVGPYIQKTEDWSGGISLLQKARKLAVSSSAKDKIDKVIETLTINEKSGNDWCGKGYYDLPSNVLDPLEKAHQYAKEEDWDAAIQVLEGIIRASPEKQPLVMKPLATCLNLQGVRNLNNAFAEMDKPHRIMLDIERNLENYISRLTQMALINNSEQDAARRGTLHCMACITIVYQWAVFTYNDRRFLICPECNRKDDAELVQRQNNFRQTLQSVYYDINRAVVLDPTNVSAVKNRNDVIEISTKVGLSLTGTGTIAPKPIPSEKPNPRPSSQSRQGVTLATHFKATVFDTLMILFLFFPLILMIRQGGNFDPFFIVHNYQYLSIILEFWRLDVVLAIMFYYGLFHWLFKRTLGEKITRTQVRSISNGSPISFTQSWWRAAVYAGLIIGCTWATTPYNIFLLALLLIKAEGKGFQDALAGTILVRD